VAFWPFFLSWRQIQALSIALLVVVLISIKLQIFNAVHAVSRNTMGEVMFAVVIGLLAFISTDRWVFVASMLYLSLADGLAAIVGLAYGAGNSYKIMGRTKSMAGSVAFFVTAVAITIFYAIFSGNGPSIASMVWLPAVATVAENLSGEGTDNLVVPLLVALALTSFA
jgi:phytol kinase